MAVAPSPVADPRAAAERAASAAGVEVRDLTEHSDLESASTLINLRWGDALTSPSLLRAIEHAGSYVSGAFESDTMVGASVGFLGIGDEGGLRLHSHITAAVASDRSVGFALKQHQRYWCLARGVPLVVWTFDPLVRRNGYFNLAKLGAEIAGYEPDFYGSMTDGINQGEETDRALVEWLLESPRAVEGSRGRAAAADVRALRDWGAATVLQADDRGSPHAPQIPADDVMLCWAPEDIVELRSADPSAARKWRLAMREVMGSAMARGYRATSMSRDGWYVLTRNAGTTRP